MPIQLEIPKTTERLPRRQKKEQQKRESPAGSPTPQPRVARVKPPRQPKLEETPPPPAPKVARQRTLASIAKRYAEHDQKGYEQAKNQDRDVKALARKIAKGPFGPCLNKFKGYNPELLMEQVITRYIRVDRPVIEPAEPNKDVVEERTPRRRTQRQLKQAEATPKPPMQPAAAKPRKAKAMAPKSKDAALVEKELNDLAQQDPSIMTALREGSTDDAMRALLGIEGFLAKLKENLLSQKGVHTHLRTAIRTLRHRYDNPTAADYFQATVDILPQEPVTNAKPAASTPKPSPKKEEKKPLERKPEGISWVEWSRQTMKAG